MAVLTRQVAASTVDASGGKPSQANGAATGRGSAASPCDFITSRAAGQDGTDAAADAGDSAPEGRPRVRISGESASPRVRSGAGTRRAGAVSGTGAAAAITHPEVVRAITSGPNRKIAVCFLEWATVGQQSVVIDWTVIGDPGAARRFGDRLVEEPRSFAGSTSISNALDFSVAQLQRAPFEAERKVIDISGDGNNNSGRSVTDARDDALARGVTINALVILTPLAESFRPEHTNPPGGLEKYFQDNVIGGFGAFTVVAESHEAFGRALTKKLIREIAGLPGPQLAEAE